MEKQNALTLYQWVALHRDSKNTALYYRGGKINYVTLLKRIDEMAVKLYSIGIRKDDVVSLLAPNVPETILCLYALNKIGAILSILHPLLPKSTLIESLSETKSKALILLDLRYPDYEEALRKLSLPVYFISAYPDLNPVIKAGFKAVFRKELRTIDKKRYLYRMKAGKDVEVPLNSDPFRPSVYLRSGGTTGKSKTVVLSDDSISFAGKQSEWILGHPIPGISMIGVLPLFHGYGLSMGVHAPLMNDAASALMVSYSGNEIIHKTRAGKLNVLIAVPYMANKLLSDPRFSGKKLRNLYATYVGADKPEESLFTRFNERMEKAGSENRLLEGYGLTETVTVNFVNTGKNFRIGSVGRPIQGVRLRIVTGGDYAHDIGPGKDGEILISSPSVCLGYLNTPKEKQPFFFDPDGTRWLLTGDVGHYDQDGYLYFRNRSTDVLKIAGYSVFPSDIERYAQEVKGVKESAAIYVPDERHPYVHLFVEKEEGVDEKALLTELKSHLKDHLIRYSVPEKITLMAQLPRTDVGKINRKELSKKA
jgi:long-chain acyl-CoA synthetase